MTIDEFKENIAPYMNEGWIAMDKDNTWWWFNVKPIAYDDVWILYISGYNCLIKDIITIEPVEDWTKSLIEVGK